MNIAFFSYILLHTLPLTGQSYQDERTRFYRKLVDFKGPANELSARVLDCLKMAKVSNESCFPFHLFYQS